MSSKAGRAPTLVRPFASCPRPREVAALKAPGGGLRSEIGGGNGSRGALRSHLATPPWAPVPLHRSCPSGTTSMQPRRPESRDRNGPFDRVLGVFGAVRNGCVPVLRTFGGSTWCSVRVHRRCAARTSRCVRLHGVLALPKYRRARLHQSCPGGTTLMQRRFWLIHQLRSSPVSQKRHADGGRGGFVRRQARSGARRRATGRLLEPFCSRDRSAEAVHARIFPRPYSFRTAASKLSHWDNFDAAALRGQRNARTFELRRAGRGVAGFGPGSLLWRPAAAGSFD